MTQMVTVERISTAETQQRRFLIAKFANLCSANVARRLIQKVSCRTK